MSEKPDGPVETAETDEMIRTAISLHRFVNKVDENGCFHTERDIFLFEGAFLAIPILLAFATELALKALLYRGGREKHARTHDLAKIYKKLNKELRDSIEEKSPPSPKVSGIETSPEFMSVSEILEFHSNAFKGWRYLHENRNLNKRFHNAALDRVLASILAVHDEKYGGRYGASVMEEQNAEPDLGVEKLTDLLWRKSRGRKTE